MRRLLIAPMLFAALSALSQTLVPPNSLPALGTGRACPSGSSCGMDAGSLSRTTAMPDFTLRRDIREVRVEFKVTDRRGRSLDFIAPEDFQIVDNGAPVTSLTGFRRESDLPINLAILIDCSRSTAAELPMEKQFALGFLRDFLRPGDKALIAGFNSHLMTPTSFTSDLPQLERSLDAIQAAGLTGFNDAVFGLASGFFPATERSSARNVLVILSDGVDSVSLHTLADAIDAALSRSITIYTISVIDKKSAIPSLDLRAISDKTGGESFYLYRRNELDKTFQRIDAELRSYFVATYHPERGADGFHTLGIRLHRKDLKAQTRIGYFASN